MVNNFKRVGFFGGLISVAAFANCNRIVLLIFFPITLRNLLSEYISLAVVTQDPFKTFGAMWFYTSLYFIAIGQEISQTFPKSIRYPLFCATNTLLDFKPQWRYPLWCMCSSASVMS
jgi:hypothetical protein